MQVYLFNDGCQAGPYTEEELRGLILAPLLRVVLVVGGQLMPSSCYRANNDFAAGN